MLRSSGIHAHAKSVVDIMIRFGFHLSIAGAVSNAAKEACSKSYGAFQIFTASSRSWVQKPINADDAEAFRDYTMECGSEPYAHIPYLCNPASSNLPVLKKSRAMLVRNLENCALLGVKGLVIHLGSHLGKGTAYGIETVVESVGEALDSVGGASILLENTSGYTNSIGSTFSEIAAIINGVGSPRLGLCLDTCHAFAAGYELRTPEGISSMVSEIEAGIGLDRLGLVHLNDAKFDRGSKRDRHWHIGKGFIGEKGFEALFSNDAFRHGSFVMETPVNAQGGEASNVKALLKILKKVHLDANQAITKTA